MKSITNHRVRSLGKKEIMAVFKSLKIKDGIGDQDINTNEFSYWYNKARDGMIGNYIIYEVVSSEPMYRADNIVIGRDFFCQVDIFSINSFESKKLKEMIRKLEEKLLERSFEIEFAEENYEPDTKLYHQIMYISKLYF